MTIWLLALLLTAIACATLYYAGAGRPVNAGLSVVDASAAHFRAQLQSIETDAGAGRLGPAEATAARGELARELIRLKAETAAPGASGGTRAVWTAVALVAVLSLGTYAALGRPDLPAAPLAGRAAASGDGIDLDAALKLIEARLAKNPDDLRGWQAIAPAYMQLGRYADAVKALRQVVQRTPPSADGYTDLGEALMTQNGDSAAGEPLELFRKAAALDPLHVRSRYYIAGEDMRTGDYAAAARDWTGLLALGKGDEPWAVTAKNGLAFAEAELHPQAPGTAAPGAAQIEAMVEGLDARLRKDGGSIDEWTRLVRSRLVQGRAAEAQAAYSAARRAYPDARDRTALDVLAADSGLVAP